MDGLPDPDGRVLFKVKNYLKAKALNGDSKAGLFVDYSCLPQTFACADDRTLEAWKHKPSWSIPNAPIERFAANGVQGDLTVIKFTWDERDAIESEEEARVREDELIRELAFHGIEPPPLSGWNEAADRCGLKARTGKPLILFHGRYKLGVYKFDRASSAEGFIRFGSAKDAHTALHDRQIRNTFFGGKKPQLMGEKVFANELIFRRGLSVMGCLYASTSGTSVLQLTNPPGGAEAGSDPVRPPEELVSSSTGTVFVLRLPAAISGAASDNERANAVQDMQSRIEKRGDVLACMNLLHAEHLWNARLVVRLDGSKFDKVAQSMKESEYPMCFERMYKRPRSRPSLADPDGPADRSWHPNLLGFVQELTHTFYWLTLKWMHPEVSPLYNARPYSQRGWPTFESAAASLVLVHSAKRARSTKAAPSGIAKADESSYKLVNIDEMHGETSNPREIHFPAKYSPERYLRQRKKILQSKKVKFTGMADRAKVRKYPPANRYGSPSSTEDHLPSRVQVLQVLADFEDSIAVQFDQARADRLRYMTKDLEDTESVKRKMVEFFKSARRSRLQKLITRFIPTGMDFSYAPMAHVQVGLADVPPPLQVQNSMKSADESLLDSYAVVQRAPSSRRGNPRRAPPDSEPFSSTQQLALEPELPEGERFVQRDRDERRLPLAERLPHPATASGLTARRLPTSPQDSRSFARASLDEDIATDAERQFLTDETVQRL